MTTDGLDWALPAGESVGDKAMRISYAVTDLGRKIVAAHYPDLVKLSPFDYHYHSEMVISDRWFAVRTKWHPTVPIRTCGHFENDNDRQVISEFVRDDNAGLWHQVMQALGSNWCSADTFTCFGKIEDSHVSWPIMKTQLNYWLSDIVLPWIVLRQ